MVTTQPLRSTTPEIEVIEEPKPFTLEDFMLHPPERTEWIDGELVEKAGMTYRHGRVQARLARHWGNYDEAQQLGGEVVTETACRTLKQGRCPDVAYVTPELATKYEESNKSSQVFPLIAEIASPDDSAEMLFAKAIEYLESGCEEVWLVFPEARLIMVKTQEQAWQLFTPGQTIRTQKLLQGFEIAIATLFD